MAFDRWSAYGVRYQNKDYIFVNIDEHKVNQLGNKFIYDYLTELTKNGNERILKSILYNEQKIVTSETPIDKNGRRFINKLNQQKILNNSQVIDLNYWGAFFAQESYNFNFLITPLKYKCDFSNYLLLSDMTCYAYIVNLDTNKFEVYIGFTEEKGNGRYGNKKHKTIETEYYGVNLIAEINIEDLLQIYQDNNQINSLFYNPESQLKNKIQYWNLDNFVVDIGRIDI